MKKKYLFNSLTFFDYFAHSLSNVLVIPFLEKLGFSSLERGFIFMIMAIISILGQIFTGYLCDKVKHMKEIMLGYTGIHILLSYILYMITNRRFFIILLLVSFSGAMARVIEGLIDSWILECKEVTKDYSFIRAFGSLGTALGAPIAGYLISLWGFESLGLAVFVMSTIALLLAIKLPNVEKTSKTPIVFGDLKKLIKNKRYMLLSLALFFAFIVGNSGAYAVVDKMMALGADEAAISMNSSIQAITEVVIFLVGSRIMNMFSTKRVLLFVLIVYIIRYICYGMAGSVTQMLLLAFGSLLTYPFLILCSKILIDKETPQELKSSGQQFSMAIYNSGSIMIAPLLSGILVKFFPMDAVMYSLSFIALISLFMVGYIYYGEF